MPEEEPEEYKKLPYLHQINLEKLVEIREAVQKEGSIGLRKLIVTEQGEPKIRNAQVLYDMVRSLEGMPKGTLWEEKLGLLADRLQQWSIVPILKELQMLGIVEKIEVNEEKINFEINCPRFL